MSNYIKLHRSMLEWEWYRNINTKVLFIHMLLKANWKEGRFEGKVIPRGSFVSSIPRLAEETELTVREVRTGISHLKTTGEVTCRSYSKFTVFTINNYDAYQVSDMQSDRQVTGNRHSNDILTTTIEEKKEYKEINNDDGDARARDVALRLFISYWDRGPSENDINRVRDLITRIIGGNVCVDENKEQLLEYAFKASSNANVCNWNYITGIMDRLRSRNISTIDEAYQYEVDNGK